MDYFSLIIIFLIIILQAVLVGLFCSYVAGQKNRSKTYWFWLGFFFSFLALIALAAIPSLSKEGADYSLYSEVKNSIGTSPAQRDTVEFFDGDRNILNPAYQLFLTRKFGIEKNLTLEKYVIKNNVFNTLEDALDNANTQYEKEQVNTIHDAVYEGNWSLVRQLLKEGVDVNQINPEGKTPLEIARERGDDLIIKLLISNGAN